eukprot:2274221-Prorocentrum_lima.AAC.1
MLGTCMEALPAHGLIEISADASFAPGGEISRTGVVVKVVCVIVHWASVKQSCRVGGSSYWGEIGTG